MDTTHHHRRHRVAAAALVWLLCVGGAANAAEIEGVEFAERAQVGEALLPLHAVGLLRYRILFKGYVAALYLAPGTPSARALEDVPRRLEIEYFWSIDGRDIADAGAELVRRNVRDEEWSRLAGRVDAINALYEDVEPGDRYALSYAPGRGTELSKNGRVLGTIEGADFARAYFAIWLGEAPIDASLRRQLLP